MSRPARRRVGADDLPAALAAVADWLASDADDAPGPEHEPEPERAAVATAVRASLRALAAAAPGGLVEVRVPPFGAVQCVAPAQGGSAGSRADRAHTRGTPPNVVETDPRTWLRLVVGRCEWEVAAANGRLRVSGNRASAVADHLPLIP